MTLEKYIEQLRHLLQNTDSIINDIIEDGGKSITVNIRQRMRQSGPFPSVGEYKNEGRKRRGGKTFRKKGNIKLYDTGDFNKSLFVEVIGNKLNLDSDDKKRNILVQEYGENIFNIKKQESDFILINYIIPGLKDFIDPKSNIEDIF